MPTGTFDDDVKNGGRWLEGRAVREVFPEPVVEPPPPAELFQEPVYQTELPKARVKPDVPMIPKGSRILVIQNAFVQRSRIYIPDTSQVKPTTGRVVAIGPDVPEGFVLLDEVVIFSLYAGIPLNIVGTDGSVATYLSLTPDEVAGELLVDPKSLKEAP